MAYITFQPKDYFNSKTWTGTGSENAITGIGFQPDWVWIKQRNTTRDHNVFDAVRGATKRIYPNATNAEDTAAQVLKSFDSDGFTLGTDTSANQSSGTYVGWNWKANGQGSSNTDGTINTTYTSVNTTSGFSISKYTGTGATATVGHGLGVVPKVIMIKGISNTGSWQFYHSSIGATKKLILNTSSAEASSGYMNNTAPTSSVFTVINDSDVGTSGYTYVAYSFAEKKGFSKFGSYTGNGNADGAFVYTGFKPAFVMIKRTNASDGWNIFDSKRAGYNFANYRLFADDTGAENTASGRIDILSNGFKQRSNETDTNGSGNPHIYMAFAEAPLVASNGDPATAR